MKKTYCDKCGKEFESYVFSNSDEELKIHAGKFETTDVFVAMSARGVDGSPHDLCKPCLLAIITEALQPKPMMTVASRCRCGFEWKPLPHVSDAACPKCGSQMVEGIAVPAG